MSDVDALVPLIGEREVAVTTLRIPHPYTEVDARDFIGSVVSGDDVRLAIEIREGQKLCGSVGLKVESADEHAELGYWIGIPFWGQGYATEAAGALLEYGFEMLKLNRIFAHHFKNNPASGRVLEKIGMRHEGEMREHIKKWGKFVDLEIYGVLRSEWTKKKT